MIKQTSYILAVRDKKKHCNGYSEYDKGEISHPKQEYKEERERNTRGHWAERHITRCYKYYGKNAQCTKSSQRMEGKNNATQRCNPLPSSEARKQGKDVP